MIVSPRQATWIAAVLAVLMVSIVLYGAMRAAARDYDDGRDPCAIVLTESGHSCR